MSVEKPEPTARSSTFNTSRQSPEPPPSSTGRQRLPSRHTDGPRSTSSPKPTLDRRRSSILSYSSIEDVTQRLTDDIINPSMSRQRTTKEDDEVTHWHSTPLAFAILPAIGGLLFKNGSAFITDALLVVLAAIFMNWSIRLPWDWYYSAQSQRRDVEPELGDSAFEDELDETAVESASSAGASPKALDGLDAIEESEPLLPQDQMRERAAAELRRQEMLALLATFVFPVLAAYLLHVIRAQLSRASTGLVSDYNLTIFLLAAEIRPCRQLIRLVTHRTLHLQRTVTGLNDPLGAAVEEKNAIGNLTSRIADLEVKLADHAILPQTMAIAQKADVSELSAEMRKRYEPRLEGLERAVRRYEKRSTTLAMLTEQRLGSLETRLQDALSLAAVAAQQSQTRGAFARLLDGLTALILFPMKLAYSLAVSPLAVVDGVYTKLKNLVGGPAPAKSAKRSTSRTGGAKDERLKEKSTARRSIR